MSSADRERRQRVDARRDDADGQDDRAHIDSLPVIDGALLPDSVILPEEVRTQFFAHGAFMGAAPEMLKDPMWNRILAVLMPDVYAEVYAALQALRGEDGSAPAAVLEFGSIISMLENNPVMAAYGMWRTKELDQQHPRQGPGGAPAESRLDTLEAFEWDVFLPTALVEQYKQATEPEKPALMADIVDEMIIAHGTLGQTIKENLPVGGTRQYGNVEQTPKTDYGGVKPRVWMDLFGRALRLAGAGEGFEALYSEYQDEERVLDERSKSDNMTFFDRLSFGEAITEYKEMFGADRLFSVIIDIKSRDATVDILNGMTRELNKRGVHVLGHGSFVWDEIEGVSGQEQVIDGQEAPRAKEIEFVHLVGSLLSGVHDGTIRDGDHVMFNAGSLLTFDEDTRTYGVDEAVVHELGLLADAHRLNLGLYVQEPDIDPMAVAVLAVLANTRRRLFTMGFAWGGMSNSASGEIATGDTARQGYGGQNHWFVAERWEKDTRAVQKSILTLWARYSDAPLFSVIQAQTGLTADNPPSDEELIRRWPVVLPDYSLLRDVKGSDLRLEWQDAGGQEGQEAGTTATIRMTLSMLGGSRWPVSVTLNIPRSALQAGAKE